MWVDKNSRNRLTLWIGLLLISVILTLGICSLIDAVSNEALQFSKNAIDQVGSYTPAYELWQNTYVILLLVATGMVIASGVVTILIPQPQIVVRSSDLKKRRLLSKKKIIVS